MEQFVLLEFVLPCGLDKIIGFGELIFAAFAIFWIWALVRCAQRKQYIWLVIVLFTFVVGAIAYTLLGRGPRPA